MRHQPGDRRGCALHLARGHVAMRLRAQGVQVPEPLCRTSPLEACLPDTDGVHRGVEGLERPGQRQSSGCVRNPADLRQRRERLARLVQHRPQPGISVAGMVGQPRAHAFA